MCMSMIIRGKDASRTEPLDRTGHDAANHQLLSVLEQDLRERWIRGDQLHPVGPAHPREPCAALETISGQVLGYK